MRVLARGRRLQPLDCICIGGFLLSIVYPLVLIPFEPALLGTHPVIVESLLGSVESLVTAGAFARVGRAALWLVILAPVFAGDALDPFSWWLGRRYGKRILTWFRGGERYRAAAERAETYFRRWGVWAILLAYYLPLPNAVIYVIAGESGMSLPLFIVLDLIGATLGLLPFILLGFAIGQGAVNLAQLVTHYAGISTIVLIVLVVAYQLFKARRRQ